MRIYTSKKIKASEDVDVNTIDINKFLQRFNKEYDFLYNSEEYVAGYDEAVDAFDEFLEDHTEFVSDFCRYRGDVISSDREAAAFMFALESFAP